MTRITIEVPDDVAARVAQAAAEAGVAPEELAGRVITVSFPARRRLSFIGIGDSGETGGDLASRVKDLRREHFADTRASDV